MRRRAPLARAAPKNGQIVRFSSAARKDNTASRRSYKLANARSRLFEYFTRLLTGAMDRRGISVTLLGNLRHCGRRRAANRRARIMVKINPHCYWLSAT